MTQSILLAAIVGILCTLVYICKNVYALLSSFTKYGCHLLFLDLTVFFGQPVFFFFISIRKNCVNNVIENMSVATITIIVVDVAVVVGRCCWLLMVLLLFLSLFLLLLLL